MLSNRRAARPLRPIALVIALYGLYWVSGFPRTYDDDELPPSQRHNVPTAVEYDQLVVSLKTTTSDLWTEIPPQLVLTDPAYYDSLLLMGDLQLNIGPFRVEDVLDRYTRKFVAETPELERYQRTLDFAVRSVDFEQLKEQDHTKEKRELAKLDKYKILRWVERTWLLRPERQWYMFTEPDVYIVRPNLLAWLGGYNPKEYHFFANPPAPGAGHSFILSQAAMRALLVDRATLIPSYDNKIQGHNSAFEVLTTMLSSTIKLDPVIVWPSISEYSPATVPYGAGLWCQHVFAMSNMTTDLLGETWRLERDRREEQTNDPLSFADLWFRFMLPENLDDPRDDWDNLSSGPGCGQWNILFDGVGEDTDGHESDRSTSKPKPGEASWEDCRDSCNEHEFCLQWSYSSLAMSNENENGETKCHLSRSMRFGSHVDAQKVDRAGEEVQLKWKSGWNKERFQRWARQQRCKNQQN